MRDGTTETTWKIYSWGAEAWVDGQLVGMVEPSGSSRVSRSTPWMLRQVDARAQYYPTRQAAEAVMARIFGAPTTTRRVS